MELSLSLAHAHAHAHRSDILSSTLFTSYCGYDMALNS